MIYESLILSRDRFFIRGFDRLSRFFNQYVEVIANGPESRKLIRASLSCQSIQRIQIKVTAFSCREMRSGESVAVFMEVESPCKS